jgi:hypothetical protein
MRGGMGEKNFLRSPVATAYSGTGVFFVWWGGGNKHLPLPGPSAEMRLVIFYFVCIKKNENRINNLNSSSSFLQY